MPRLFLVLGIALCLLAIAPARANETLNAARPAKRESTPFQIAAIVEQLRKLSGDSSYAATLDAPPAPPPSDNASEESTDAGSPEAEPVAEEETPPSDSMEDPDLSSKGPKVKKASAPPRPSSNPLDDFRDAQRRQMDQFRKRHQKQTDDFRAAMQAQREKWLAAYAAMKERWFADRARFLKSIGMYKSHLTPLTAARDPRLPKATHKPGPKDVAPDSFVLVNGATEVPVRDQADRGTCAAFAGVRALETVAKGAGRDVDLSEQFFYWLSKPDCQQAPCDGGGSWVVNAYAANLDAPDLVIPEEVSCPYNGRSMEGNDTQTPLADRCSEGAVLRLSGVAVVHDTADVLRVLDRGLPVVVGTRLSENYFKSTGVVTQAAANETTRDSIHADGHAYLAVGYLALPKAMQATEGAFCLIVANSWGEGWGAGGYSCVTENWFNTHRIDMDFLAPGEVVVR